VKLDPAYRPVLESLRRSTPIELLTVAEGRARIAEAAAKAGPPPEVGSVENITFDHDGATFPGRVYFPAESPPKAVMLYFHGGGWVLGSIDSIDVPVRMMCQRLGAVIISVDYPLAPENPFPAAVDAVWSALSWADSFRSDRELISAPLVVGGDSSGANLAAVTAIRARDATIPVLDAQLLICPVTDCSMATPSYQQRADGYLLSSRLMGWFWDQYALPAMRRDSRASPLYATSFQNLPAAVVITAEYDPLRDEGELYATQLRQAGVRVISHRFENQLHGFLGMAPTIASAKRALEFSCDGLTRILTDRS
jgi:acetyl esterase